MDEISAFFPKAYETYEASASVGDLYRQIVYPPFKGQIKSFLLGLKRKQRPDQTATPK